MTKPRATLCGFSHVKIEITSSKGVYCTRWENLRTCRKSSHLPFSIPTAIANRICRRHLIGW